MLICPECQSKNLNTNKFCQHCGTSLTHTNCHHCGAEISLVSLKCDRCGTPNGKKLTALVILQEVQAEETPQLELVPNVVGQNNHHSLELAPESSQAAIAEQNTTITQEYLDAQQRYYHSPEYEQEIDLTFPPESPTPIVHTQVMDKFPLKESYLESLKKQQEDLWLELGSELDRDYLSPTEDCADLGIPAIALPYLKLQHYTPVIPPIYDTWQDSTVGALLLSDRSAWQLLTALWTNRDTPGEQILWSLNEILKYWHPLSKTGCLTTLLVEENLRIDEDHSLGFRQLYFDNPDKSPNLTDLAAKWHEWLSKSPENYHRELEQIIENAIAGKFNSVREIKEALSSLVPPEENISEESEFSSQETNSVEDAENIDSEKEEREDLFVFEHQEIDSLFGNQDCEDQPTATLAMEIASVTDASCTDIGSQRNHNEDFFVTKTTITQEENPGRKTVNIKGLYVVCDGMGGHSAGEVASSMAVETLQNYFHAYWKDELPSEEAIKDGILLANRTIYQTNVDNNRSGHGMMGTTLVMALLQNTQLAIAHVGDSRIYRVGRTLGLEQLTQDHEVGQREINRGVEPEIAYARPDAYQLTQALGPRDNKYIKPAIQFLEIQEDCVLLLCSDGLCDNQLVEKHWETYLQPLISSSADIQSGLFQLIDFADRYNGHDNITGILLRIKLQPNFET